MAAPIYSGPVNGTPVRLILVRHGETVSNLEGRWQGQSDSPLSERGVLQAEALAEALAAEPIQAVYSSDMGRAIATGAPVAARHGLQVTTDARLREIHVGTFTDQLAAENRREHPELMDAWAHRPWTVTFPEGESLQAVWARIEDFLAETLPRHRGETVVLVSHGATAQVVRALGLGKPGQELWHGSFENCQITRMEWSAEAGFSMVEECDVRHLELVGSVGGWRVLDTTESATVEK